MDCGIPAIPTLSDDRPAREAAARVRRGAVGHPGARVPGQRGILGQQHRGGAPGQALQPHTRPFFLISDSTVFSRPRKKPIIFTVFPLKIDQKTPDEKSLEKTYNFQIPKA